MSNQPPSEIPRERLPEADNNSAYPGSTATRGRKSLMLAAMLQGIPVLGAAGCIANGATNQHAQGWALLLWLSVLLWGIGYMYVGALGRAAIVFFAGPALAFASCTASFSGVSYDYEHASKSQDSSGADRASIQTGLLVGIAVMILAVDAVRLAAARNDAIDNGAFPPGAGNDKDMSR